MAHPLRSPRWLSRRPAQALAAIAVLASAAGSMLLFSSSASAAVAAAPSGVDRVVSLSGTIDSTCGSGIPGGTPVNTTIQAAVNAATLGQQIYVCAGTYTENVSVTTNNIDLLGPNWNDPSGGSDAAVIFAATAGSPVVNLGTASASSNGVLGFTLQGGTYGVRAQASSGCCWTAATEGIRNNTITGSTVAGVETNGLDTGIISGNTITPASGGDGIRTFDAAGSLDIQANTIDLSGTGVGITYGGGGEQCCQTIGGSSAALGNKITGGQTGILSIDTVPGGLLVDANTIQFNQVSGTSGDGISLSGPILTTNIYDNTIASPGGSGIRIANSYATTNASGNNVYRNTITSPGTDGVRVTGNVTTLNIGNSAANGNTITAPGRYGVSATGDVVTADAQLTRVFNQSSITANGNSISSPGSDGIHFENVETSTISNNTVLNATGDGIAASAVDNVIASGNTVTGSPGDGVHFSDVAGGTLTNSTVTGNTGDGIELTANTSSITVTGNTVTGNAAGVRITSPTVRASSFISGNDVKLNTGYGCEDQSSGSISNPPAAGTQGNDWTTTNTGAALQSPDGICGDTMTAAGPLADGVVGTPYSQTMNVSGSTGPYLWYSTALPSGLSLNLNTGVVSGTPTTAVTNKDVTFWVYSTSTFLWGQVKVPITVTDAPTPLSASGTLSDATLNTPYMSATPTVTGGTGPYTWTATGLPAGLNVDPATGVVSGTPTTAVADQPVVLTVTDSTGATATIDTTITVLPDDPGVPMSDPLIAGVAVIGLVGAAAVRLRRSAA